MDGCLGSGAAQFGAPKLFEAPKAAKACLRGFFGDERGVVALVVALAMPVLAGTMGLAAEASYWLMHQRAMQNAADAAAIAAATNNGSAYASEAKAVAAQYGFQDGSGNVTVTVASSNTATNCTANCYTVTISDEVPLFLSQVIGYTGTTTVNKKGMTAITAAAVAMTRVGSASPYCILALRATSQMTLFPTGRRKPI